MILMLTMRNDEPIPIYTVNGETLAKVIEWTKYQPTSPSSKPGERRSVLQDEPGEDFPDREGCRLS